MYKFLSCTVSVSQIHLWWWLVNIWPQGWLWKDRFSSILVTLLWINFTHRAQYVLKRPTHTKVCSPACVLYSGCSSFIRAGENSSLHLGDTWLRKWNISMILSTFSQLLSKGGGRGRGFRATLSFARLHMLSYATATADGGLGNCNSHYTKTKKTWDGDWSANKKGVRSRGKEWIWRHCSSGLCGLWPHYVCTTTKMFRSINEVWAVRQYCGFQS